MGAIIVVVAFRLGFVAGVRRFRHSQERNLHFTVEVRIPCAEMSALLWKMWNISPKTSGSHPT